MTLTDRIGLTYPPDLSFSNCMHRLIALDRSPRPVRGSESEAGVDALLDEPMILLDDVVQIRGSSTTATTAEFTGLLQLGDRAGVCRMPI